MPKPILQTIFKWQEFKRTVNPILDGGKGYSTSIFFIIKLIMDDYVDNEFIYFCYNKGRYDKR